MRGILLEGKWVDKDSEVNAKGKFVRSNSLFRNHIEDEKDAIFAAEKDRYHLYISYACPWAHRTLMALYLKGLQETISYSVVGAEKEEGDWVFTDEPGAIQDNVNNAKFLREIYVKAEKHYSGRVTIPVLWDKKLKTIVNNESRDIVRIFDTEFNAFSTSNLNLYPQDKEDEIDLMIEKNYHTINNGVYKAGFAKNQKTYDESVQELFDSLDHLDKLLSDRPYLMGGNLTEADICLFPTLIRFDAVYYTLFKCSYKHLYDYENIWRYVINMYNRPEIAITCNFEHIKRHYFTYLTDLNPSKIVPITPDIERMLLG